MCKNLDTHTINGMDSDSVITEGGVLASGYGGFYAGEMLTDNVDTLKENKLISGGLKVGAAFGLPFLVPFASQNRFVSAFLLGFGISGGKDLVTALQTPATAGLDGWENWDNNGGGDGDAVRVDA